MGNTSNIPNYDLTGTSNIPNYDLTSTSNIPNYDLTSTVMKYNLVRDIPESYISIQA